jgi:hypothetical protein
LGRSPVERSALLAYGTPLPVRRHGQYDLIFDYQNKHSLEGSERSVSKLDQKYRPFRGGRKPNTDEAFLPVSQAAALLEARLQRLQDRLSTFDELRCLSRLVG